MFSLDFSEFRICNQIERFQMQTSIQILMPYPYIKNTYNTVYMDSQTFLQCNSLDVFSQVPVLFVPCPQAESILAAGQNKPATESSEPDINATNLTILLLSLMYLFWCWHIWKNHSFCVQAYVCALWVDGCVRALLRGACVTWYGLSQYAAGGLKQEIHFSLDTQTIAVKLRIPHSWIIFLCSHF